MDIAKLLEGGNLKTAEDQDCAGRLIAHGYSHEMNRLCRVVGLDKMAGDIEDGAVMADSEEEAVEEEPVEEDSMAEDDILALLKELGGV